MTLAWLVISLGLVAEPPGKLTLVLELEAGHGVAPDLAHTLSEAELADIREIAGTRVLGTNDLKSLLGLERQKQLLGCKADTSCFAEIGSAMGAKEIVTGSLSTVGDTFLLVLRRIDVAHTQVLREGQRTRKTSDEAGLLTDLPALARQIFTPTAAELAKIDGGATPPTPVAVAATPTPAATTVADLQATYRSACDQGHGDACYQLATFLYGDSPAEAAAIFQRGCDLGAPLGCFRAAFIYQVGAKGLHKDPALGIRLLQRACDASTGKGAEGKALDGGCIALSSYYLHGLGVPADPPRAVDLLRKLCDRGNDDGCASLANAEIHGPAAVQNVAHGRLLSQRLCDEGHSGACNDAK